ncbi:hypothetical protein BCR34DRAFT_595538 [Clohesyomyces aquaticus]|uniref:UBA domain-containing protein n=1 Tax=Clohesyomyces aquaticus TaxID=1231657 RepID=A0A1Y2AAK4_9PLEO|nr:hypothetical protein BCR34DRAFT_595538 [Clohesyomyces aquaticus]
MPKRKADAAVMEADGGNTSKKKKADKKADKGMEKQKEVKADKKGRERDGGYSTQQKSAISQFMNFTSTDRNTAIRHLKSSGWNQEQAVNG